MMFDCLTELIQTGISEIQMHGTFSHGPNRNKSSTLTAKDVGFLAVGIAKI